MNKISIILVIAILFIGGCQPSQTAIQTAIAQTQVALPTNTPTQLPTNTVTKVSISTPTITLTATITPTSTQTLLPAKQTAAAKASWKTKVAPYQSVRGLGVYYESYMGQPVMVTGEVLITHDAYHITIFEGGGNKIAVSLDESINNIYQGDTAICYGTDDGKYDTHEWSSYSNTVVLINAFCVKK